MRNERNNPASLTPFWGFTPRQVLIFCLLLSAPLYFLRGFGVFDDSFFLKFGEEIARGALPYRDVFENKTPLTFYFAALIAWIGKGHWLAPRVSLFLLAALHVSVFHALLKRRFSKSETFLATLLFTLSYTLGQGYSLHTEQLCSLMGFIGVAFITGNTRKLHWAWVVSGVFLCLSFLSKQPAILYTIGVVTHTLAIAMIKKQSLKKLGMRVGLLTLGFFATLAIPVSYFASQGALYEVYDAVFRNTKTVALHVALSPVLALQLWALIPSLSATAVSVLLLTFSKSTRAALSQRKDPVALSLWFVTAGLSLLPNFRIQNLIGHYALPAVAGFSILNAVVMHPFLSSLKYRTAAVAALVTPYALAIAWGGISLIRDGRVVFDLEQRREIRILFDAKLKPEDPVLCVSSGSAARLYYVSGRRPMTRYMHFGINFLDRFNLYDAIKILRAGEAPGVLIDIPEDWYGYEPLRPYIANDFAALQEHYEVLPLLNSYHPIHHSQTFVLIRKDS